VSPANKPENEGLMSRVYPKFKQYWYLMRRRRRFNSQSGFERALRDLTMELARCMMRMREGRNAQSTRP
jgi:hypothetical protein